MVSGRSSAHAGRVALGGDVKGSPLVTGRKAEYFIQVFAYGEKRLVEVGEYTRLITSRLRVRREHLLVFRSEGTMRNSHRGE